MYIYVCVYYSRERALTSGKRLGLYLAQVGCSAAQDVGVRGFCVERFQGPAPVGIGEAEAASHAHICQVLACQKGSNRSFASKPGFGRPSFREDSSLARAPGWVPCEFGRL